MARILPTLTALILLSTPAAAQWEGKWGAIAYGGPEQSFGVAVDYASAEEARRAAFDNCGGRCSQSIAFIKTCAAVAESTAGNLAWASNRWRGRAMSRALELCARTGPACTVIAWACTTH